MRRGLALFFVALLAQYAHVFNYRQRQLYYYRVPLRRSAYHVLIINTRGEAIAVVFLFFLLFFFSFFCEERDESLRWETPRKETKVLSTTSETGVYSIKTGTSRQYWHSAVTEYNISDKGQQWKRDSGKRHGRKSIAYRTSLVFKRRRKYRELRENT